MHKMPRDAPVGPGPLLGLAEADEVEVFIGGERPGKTGRGGAGNTLGLVVAQESRPRGIGHIRPRRISDAAC